MGGRPGAWPEPGRADHQGHPDGGRRGHRPAVDVAPGQASDFTFAEAVLHRTLERGPVDEVVADKGFDGDELRGRLIDRNVCPVIPSKANRTDPWPFDPRAYRDRNKVERLFAKLKQFRRVATRYDKLRATLPGLLHLVLGFIRLRSSVTRPSHTRSW